MEDPTKLLILYEDNHLIAIHKPAGLLSQGDLSGDLDVLTVVKQMIKDRDNKPGNVFLGLVHRLDRPAGGTMLLAKTSKAASRLSAQFRARETRKIYRAVVHGKPRHETANLEHLLQKDKASLVTKVVSSNGKQAHLAYKVLDSRAGQSLLEIDLKTGLSHQIRAQLSHVGHPILGDRKYKSRQYLKTGPGIIALYSRSIEFAHPVKKSRLLIETTNPDWWPW